jgi:hypothetical protein
MKPGDELGDDGNAGRDDSPVSANDARRRRFRVLMVVVGVAAAAIVVAVALAGRDDGGTAEEAEDEGANAVDDVLTSVAPVDPVELCLDRFYPVLLARLNLNSPTAFDPLIDAFGEYPPRLDSQSIWDVAQAASVERIDYGIDAADRLVLGSATDLCGRSDVQEWVYSVPPFPTLSAQPDTPAWDCVFGLSEEILYAAESGSAFFRRLVDAYGMESGIPLAVTPIIEVVQSARFRDGLVAMEFAAQEEADKLCSDPAIVFAVTGQYAAPPETESTDSALQSASIPAATLVSTQPPAATDDSSTGPFSDCELYQEEFGSACDRDAGAASEVSAPMAGTAPTSQGGIEVCVPGSSADVYFSSDGRCLESDPATACGQLGVTVFREGDGWCPEITHIQAALVLLGYDFIDIDGFYGLDTQQTVMNFQRFNGLEPDGLVGPTTWLRLAAG